MHKHEDPSVIPRTHVEKLSLVGYSCHPSTGIQRQVDLFSSLFPIPSGKPEKGPVSKNDVDISLGVTPEFNL